MEKRIPPLASKQLEEMLVPIENLKPHPENYKEHPDDQLSMLRASLLAFGWTKPIFANPKNQIVAGHGMYMAALEQGYTHVPVEYLAFDSNQSKAYLVADNELSRKAVTNQDKLDLLLTDISQFDDFDITATGFTPEDVEMLLNSNELGSNEEAEDEAEAAIKNYTNIEKDTIIVFHALAGEALGYANHYNYLFSYTQGEKKIRQPFPDDSILFLDSGALAGVKRDGPEFLSLENQEKILRYAEEMGAHWVTMLDVPFVDQVLEPLGKTLEEAYQIHIRNAKAFNKLQTTVRKVYVIQGQTYAEYLRCCNDMKELINPEDVVAIGTIKAKSTDENMIEKVTALVHSHFPNNDLHLFGITRPETVARAARVGATSCDSASVSMYSRTGEVTRLAKTTEGSHSIVGVPFNEYCLTDEPLSLSTLYWLGSTVMGMFNMHIAIALEMKKLKEASL
jgi:hypothetical protein